VRGSGLKVERKPFTGRKVEGISKPFAGGLVVGKACLEAKRRQRGKKGKGFTRREKNRKHRNSLPTGRLARENEGENCKSEKKRTLFLQNGSGENKKNSGDQSKIRGEGDWKGKGGEKVTKRTASPVTDEEEIQDG